MVGGLAGWVKKVKGLSKKQKRIDADNSMLTTRGKGILGEVEEGKDVINEGRRRLGFEW